MKIPILKKDNVLLKDSLETGFLVLVNKPAGWTSFDVCRKIRNIVHIKKVGHAGTLDPFATGLMILGVGKGTKTMSDFLQSSKVYDAVIQFGFSTDTYDITGQKIAEKSEFILEQDLLCRHIKSTIGAYDQIPPMYSAKKVNGKALYKYARNGIEVERKPVTVQIFDVNLKSWEKPLLNLRMHVSKGTYIRSYAHDLGESLKVPAVLKELKRIAIGDMKIEESFTIEEFIEFWKKIAA
ncbi:MAG: tRNA pseudouridine(55) synthase TruB [Calditrichae bacterium]|nr:tRNA pseudouridine(55) synthase TruB [Calditrichota bacterium]MCB9057378.1 tRNA pseudouridine(55) synthase TruB [Calditrichia bacterium]